MNCCHKVRVRDKFRGECVSDALREATLYRSCTFKSAAQAASLDLVEISPDAGNIFKS